MGTEVVDPLREQTGERRHSEYQYDGSCRVCSTHQSRFSSPRGFGMATLKYLNPNNRNGPQGGAGQPFRPFSLRLVDGTAIRSLAALLAPRRDSAARRRAPAAREARCCRAPARWHSGEEAAVPGDVEVVERLDRSRLDRNHPEGASERSQHVAGLQVAGLRPAAPARQNR